MHDREQPEVGELATSAKPSPPVLEYSNLAPERTRAQIDPLLLIFAAGAYFPFIVLAFAVGEAWPVMLGFCVTWGETGALLVSLKIRRRCTGFRSKSRPPWAWLAAGATNTIAIAVIVILTTRRDPFWPLLGQGGSILSAFALAGIVSAILAMILLRPASR